MLDCISVENMRRSDALTIQRYVPSLELMGRAAMGVFLATAWKGPVAIVAGSGNNGGDGFALACILQEKKIDCTVFTLSEKLSADSAFYAEKAREMGVKVKTFTQDCLPGFSMVVDCLLGPDSGVTCGKATALPLRPSMPAMPWLSAWISTAA